MDSRRHKLLKYLSKDIEYIDYNELPSNLKVEHSKYNYYLQELLLNEEISVRYFSKDRKSHGYDSSKYHDIECFKIKPKGLKAVADKKYFNRPLIKIYKISLAVVQIVIPVGAIVIAFMSLSFATNSNKNNSREIQELQDRIESLTPIEGVQKNKCH